MSLLYAVLCGVVQGACEFLPISSSGHLALIHSIFGRNMSGGVAFDVLLHFGTLFAVVVVYRRDVYAILRAAVGVMRKIFRGKFKLKEAEPDERTALWLALSSAPLALAALIEDKVETLGTYPRAVGAMLVLNGAMLLLLGKKKSGTRRCSDLGAAGAAGVGLFQLAAVLPGISRSGSTIVGGEIFGLDRTEAVRFSFLLSVPAIAGANIFSAIKAVGSGASVEFLPCAVGAASAAATGFLAIWIIKNLAESKKFGAFGIYCIAIGTAALISG